jgi:cytochrome c-type biogenesis protein CcmH
VRDFLRFAVIVAAGSSVACGGSTAPRPAATAGAPSPAADAAASGLPPGHPPIAPAGPAPAGSRAQARLSGTIDLSPRLAAGPGDVLYVMARKGAATLVVRRIEQPVFPLRFELSDDDAMVSGVPFEGPVELVARLSRTGDAIPAKGDLEGVRKDVAVPSSGVRVTIDTVRP